MDVTKLSEKPIDQLSREEAELLVDHYKQLSAKYTAYEQAVKEKYRFFSYGDAMLIL